MAYIIYHDITLVGIFIDLFFHFRKTKIVLIIKVGFFYP